MLLLHISDLHFGPKYLPHVGEALLRQSTLWNADLIVASGDFTQRAKRLEFRAAREFLDQLPDVPLVVVPGNHDVPLYRCFERLLSPHRNYQQSISSELNRVWQTDDAVIVGLDSTSPWQTITNGIVTRRQLDFCQKELQNVPPETMRIVVTHHPFIRPGDFEKSHLIRRPVTTFTRFCELQVDLVLGGHLHRSFTGNSRDVVPPIPGRDLFPVQIVQCGTSTSSRGRGREKGCNSLNLIEIDQVKIAVTPHLYDSKLEAFVPAGLHTFSRCSGVR